MPAAAQEGAFFKGATAAQELGSAVRAFARATTPAAPSSGPKLRPSPSTGAAGAPGLTGARGEPGASMSPAAAPDQAHVADAAGVPETLGGPGASTSAAAAPDQAAARGRAAVAPLAAAVSQDPVTVKRLVVRSLGAPEWRLRAPQGLPYPTQAEGSRGSASYRDRVHGHECGSTGGELEGGEDTMENSLGCAWADAGTEVLRAAFRMKGALRASRCAGMLSFPGGVVHILPAPSA